jgi:LPS export ABC transporter protein LptC
MDAQAMEKKALIMRNVILLILGLVFCSGLMISCTTEKENIPVSSDRTGVPVQEFDSTTLYFYIKNYVQWKLFAEYMRKPIADTGSIFVRPVRLVSFDSLGNLSTKVISDSGTTNNAMDQFFIWGNVYIRTADSLVVRTERLWWYKNTRRVTSDTYVQIETPKGDILRGKGLDATEDFSRFNFKSNVSGKFPDFKTRVESNEKSFF